MQNNLARFVAVNAQTDGSVRSAADPLHRCVNHGLPGHLCVGALTKGNVQEDEGLIEHFERGAGGATGNQRYSGI